MPDLLDPSIFSYLEDKIEEEAQVRDSLGQIVQRLERVVATTQAHLSRVHSLPRARYAAVIEPVEACIKEQISIVAELNRVASQHPYYKYNQKWTRPLQSAISTALYNTYISTLPSPSLLTLTDVGALFKVPTNLKSEDAFHISIEEYLLALTELTGDLSRLATNAVTQGDFDLPLSISQFVKDIFAGFQLLNLKNDVLRKRFDGVKYDVKRVEDVVYDLSLRGLVHRPQESDTEVSG